MIEFILIAGMTLEGCVSNISGRIGIEDIRSTGKITKIYKPSPAFDAGLKEGDIILAADDVKGTSHIRGDAGTFVKLTVKRKNDIFTVMVKRVPDNEIH